MFRKRCRNVPGMWVHHASKRARTVHDAVVKVVQMQLYVPMRLRKNDAQIAHLRGDPCWVRSRTRIGRACFLHP